MAKAGSNGDLAIDLEGLTDSQLRDLVERARAALQERISSRLDEFKALAREAGFSLILERIEEGRGTRRRAQQEGEAGEDQRRIVSPKYRNPDKAEETWSGRGRAPRWMDEKVKAGGKREDFLIAAEASRESKVEAA